MKSMAMMTEQEVRKALYDILWAIEQLPNGTREELWKDADMEYYTNRVSR